jgi:uncharacterized protein YgiM (DUF1202 family)
MKKTFWTIYVAMISTATGLLAQDVTAAPDAANTNEASVAPIETPAPAPAVTAVPEIAPATPPPAPPEKPAVRKKAAPTPELRTVPLVPGPATVSANRVNVRGQAGLKGEVLTRMTNGEPVMVIEEIRLKRSAPEEPSVWAKIVLPEKVRVWVHTAYIDKATKTVTARKLNLRGGSGENFSILGTLKRGDVVKEIEVKGDWMQIEAPADAYAFMAAQYLTQEPAVVLAASGSTGEQAAPPTDTTTIVELTSVTEETPMSVPDETEETSTGLDEPPPPRVISHEGIVRSATSIQAPTSYELINPETRRIVNYLYTTSTNVDLSRYKGLHIIVTGEEGLDERWRNTPVITIRRIQVID